MEYNPYAAPIAPPPPAAPAGEDGYIEGGRPVEASRGYAWIVEGWGLVKGQVGTWVVIGVLYTFLTVGVALVPVAGPYAIAMLSPFLSAGTCLGCRDLRQGRELRVGHLFEGFGFARGLLVIGLLHVAQALVSHGVELLLGATPGAFGAPARGPMDLARLEHMSVHAVILFVIGMPTSMATYYAPALLALQGLTPLAAIKNSFSGAWKNVLPFMVYSVMIMVFVIGAAIPCGLGMFVLFPVLIAAHYVGYRDVFFVG